MNNNRVRLEQIAALKHFLSNYIANLTSCILLFTLSSLSSPWKYNKLR